MIILNVLKSKRLKFSKSNAMGRRVKELGSETKQLLAASVTIPSLAILVQVTVLAIYLFSFMSVKYLFSSVMPRFTVPRFTIFQDLPCRSPIPEYKPYAQVNVNYSTPDLPFPPIYCAFLLSAEMHGKSGSVWLSCDSWSSSVTKWSGMYHCF